MTRQAWFCPACQKHHAPHCDTCPTERIAVPDINQPVIVPVTIPKPIYWEPDPTRTPWMPSHPIVTCAAPQPADNIRN